MKYPKVPAITLLKGLEVFLVCSGVVPCIPRSSESTVVSIESMLNVDSVIPQAEEPCFKNADGVAWTMALRNFSCSMLEAADSEEETRGDKISLPITDHTLKNAYL
jgi:hypothetical protein